MEKIEANDKTFVDPLVCEAIKIAVELDRLNEDLRNELKKIAKLGQTKVADEMIVATIKVHSQLYEVEAAKFDYCIDKIIKSIVSLDDHFRLKTGFPNDFESIIGRKIKLPRKLRNKLRHLSISKM